MYRRIDFTRLEGLPLTQNTMEFIQSTYGNAISAIAAMIGDNSIVSGVADLGANYGNGWVVIGGELLPFVGGVKAPRIVIEETVVAKQFQDGTSRDIWYTRVAKCGSSGGVAFTSFYRFMTIRALIPVAVQAYNDSQTALTNAAAAQGTANSALSNAATAQGTANTALSNAATAQGTANTANLTANNALAAHGGLLKKVVQIGDWNMDTNDTVSVAHGLADYKKIRSLSGIIRNDTDTANVPFPRTDYVASGPTGNIDFIRIDGLSGSNINLRRAVSGGYDNTAYDSTSYNRGWIVIEYEA